MYVIGKYLTNNKIYSNIIIQITLAISMIYVAFSPKNIKQLLKFTVLFYLTSFVFGGCAFALLYYVKPQEILYKNGILRGTYPIKIAFLGAMIGLVLLNIAFKLIKNRMSKKDMFCNVKVCYEGKFTTVSAIIDSGNLLKEPITGVPVIIVEKGKLEKIIQKHILDNLQKIISGEYETDSEEYISRLRLIPFSSLGKQNGMLLGFKPDWTEIEFDDTNKRINNVIIGIYDKEITKTGNYQAIVGWDIFEYEKSTISDRVF